MVPFHPVPRSSSLLAIIVTMQLTHVGYVGYSDFDVEEFFIVTFNTKVM